jgi:hypothetical protein
MEAFSINIKSVSKMHSFKIKALLAPLAFSVLLVEASPFNLAPHKRLELHGRAGTKATSAAGTGASTSTAATATASLNAAILDCHITVRDFFFINPRDIILRGTQKNI